MYFLWYSNGQDTTYKHIVTFILTYKHQGKTDDYVYMHIYHYVYMYIHH